MKSSNVQGHVWSKNFGKSSQNKRQTKTNKTTTTTTTRKSPSQICVSPQSKTAKQQRTGQGPTKTKQNTIRFALDTVTEATVSSSKTCKLIIIAAVREI